MYRISYNHQIFAWYFGMDAYVWYLPNILIFYAALFHKKHFKVPRGATDAYYVCNKCLSEKVLNVKSPQKKVVSKKNSLKKKTKKQSLKIVTRSKQIVAKSKKKMGKNKGKRGRPRKYPLNESKNKLPELRVKEPANVPKNEPAKRISKRLYSKYMKGNSNISERSAKRRRTASHYSYWLDGLRWTQNPNDDRAISFRTERVVFPCEDADLSEVFPVCRLCQKCYSGESIYIACEDCGGNFLNLHSLYRMTIFGPKRWGQYESEICLDLLKQINRFYYPFPVDYVLSTYCF